MKSKFIFAHMAAAKVYAGLSTCVNAKVGCVLVKNGTPIAIGYNGTKPGQCNCCEDPTTGRTHAGVRHAEVNALNKLWTSKESADGAVAFVSLSPCADCAQDLHHAGIRTIVFGDCYRDPAGLVWAINAGMNVYRVVEDKIFQFYGDNAMLKSKLYTLNEI